MLGISIYFQDLDYEYLKQAAKLGVKYVFTSLQIPEEDYSSLKQELPTFLKTCNELNLELVFDVSPVTFEKVGLVPFDFEGLRSLGFKALRLDYGFDNYELIKTLLKDFKLILNASVIDQAYLNGAIEAGIDLQQLILTHNFYPRSDTGLSLEYFLEKNKLFHQYGLKVQAFVCGDDLKRFPLYEGLPTVENHRTIHPYIAAIELIKKCHVDDVLIGDSKAKIETIQFILEYLNDNVINIKAHLEPDYYSLYNQIYTTRKDLSEKVVRITTPRTKGIRPCNNGNRYTGAITIDNELMGRYCGEVQLIKKDLGMDSRVNVIGFIHPEFIKILDYIDYETKIKFVKL